MKLDDPFYQLSPNLSKFEDNIKINYSSFHFNKDYNNKFNFLLKQILGLSENRNINYDLYNEKMKKTLAFKENIFVHNKNLTLNENHKNNDFLINNSKRTKYFLNYNTNKNESKYIRPNSAIINFNSNIKNSAAKSKIILDQNLFDISYIKNNRTKINIKTFPKNKKEYKKNKKSLIYKKSQSVDISNNLNNNNFNDIKTEIRNKIMNLKFKKNNNPQMFIRRPIPTLNEKYLLYLPKDLQKDIKNKYNFFSYILTDDIYHNKNFIRSKKSRKYSGKVQINKNNNSNNLFNNYMLKTKIEKKSKIINYPNKKIDTVNKIYKPVKLKADELLYSKAKVVKEKEEEKEKIKTINEEEGDLAQKIKSNPFKVKKYGIF